MNPYDGTLKPGVRRIANRNWQGVLREGRRVVGTCGHVHTNRDLSSYRSGESANDCVKRQYSEMLNKSAFAEQNDLERSVYTSNDSSADRN